MRYRCASRQVRITASRQLRLLSRAGIEINPTRYTDVHNAAPCMSSVYQGLRTRSEQSHSTEVATLEPTRTNCGICAPHSFVRGSILINNKAISCSSTTRSLGDVSGRGAVYIQLPAAVWGAMQPHSARRSPEPVKPGVERVACQRLVPQTGYGALYSHEPRCPCCIPPRRQRLCKLPGTGRHSGV